MGLPFDIPSMIKTVGELADDLFTTDEEKREFVQRANELADKGDARELQAMVQLAMGQLQINKAEAESSSLFKGGWRPFIGWICGASFGYVYLFQPFLIFIALLIDSSFPIKKLPDIDIAAMMPVMMGMLGLGALRTYERKIGKIPKGN